MRARGALLAAVVALAGAVAAVAFGADPARGNATRVTVFGDSAATAMAYDPKARSILGAGIDLKLEVAACRRLGEASCPYDGVRPPNVIERASALGRELGRVVVVAVGYNDYETTYADNIEETLRVLEKAGVERVLWTTLRAGRQSWARMNEMILAAARKHAEMTVLDWNTRAAANAAWLQPDGIHLTAVGAQGMATMISDALVGLGVAARPAAARGVLPLSIPARPLPGGRVGRRYTAHLTVRGGKAPYRWARVGGTMPKGLRLGDSVIQGRPNEPGRYRIALRVLDGVGNARTRVFVLAVTR